MELAAFNVHRNSAFKYICLWNRIFWFFNVEHYKLIWWHYQKRAGRSAAVSVYISGTFFIGNETSFSRQGSIVILMSLLTAWHTLYSSLRVLHNAVKDLMTVFAWLSLHFHRAERDCVVSYNTDLYKSQNFRLIFAGHKKRKTQRGPISITQ